MSGTISNMRELGLADRCASRRLCRRSRRRLALLVLRLLGPALAQEALAPSPRAVIYPGDVIRDDMLTDIPRGRRRATAAGPIVEDRAVVVGKMARLTLLPGHAIPYAGVSNRKLVANGAEVKLVYAEGGLLIVTSGAALQDGVDRRRRAGAQQRQRRHRFRRRAAGRLGQGRRRMRRLLLALAGAVSCRRARRGGAHQGHCGPARPTRQPARRLRPRRRPERHRRHVPQRAVHPAGGAGHAAEPRHGRCTASRCSNRNVAGGHRHRRSLGRRPDQARASTSPSPRSATRPR